MDRPNYSVFVIDLSAGGTQDIRGDYDYLHLINALDINGNPALSVLVNVSISQSQGDLIPTGLNGKVRATTDFYRLTWAAQPNVTASFLLSMDNQEEGVSGDFPPTKQIITTSAGSTITATQGAAGVAAAIIAAASGTRQAVTIKNRHATLSLFVGGVGVTAATGYELLPGESITLSGQTAAVYGISTAAGCSWACLVEN